MTTRTKITILKNQLEDVLREISENGMGLIVENDTILLVNKSEVQKYQKSYDRPGHEFDMIGPVQVVNLLKSIDCIDDCGALLGAGAV